VLREAGLVVDEREGTMAIYRVRDPRVFDLMDSLKALAPEAEAGLSSNLRRMRFRFVSYVNCKNWRCRCPRCQTFE